MRSILEWLSTNGIICGVAFTPPTPIMEHIPGDPGVILASIPSGIVKTTVGVQFDIRCKDSEIIELKRLLNNYVKACNKGTGV
jgi:hypothetical protein